MLKGTIIENSLRDKTLLDRVQVLQTRKAGGWTLHDVLMEEALIPGVQKALDSGPWYIHLWEPGSDLVKVVFRDTLFDIRFSDKATWRAAVAYGKSIGIPEEQLDFRIV